MKNVVIFGAGYVGLAIATLLSVKNTVTIVEVDQSKIEKINSRISPIKDEKIEEYFLQKKLRLTATSDFNPSVSDADLVILALPTNFDDQNNSFDTTVLDNVLAKLAKIDANKAIVIKSTCPIGYTDSIQKRFGLNKTFFSPEFLREGKALEDNLYPSRVVIGTNEKHGAEFYRIMLESALTKKSKCIYTDNKTAEAIKLASNAYLAMRVAYFNEVDSLSYSLGIDTNKFIDGICADPRIGESYNNPSYGFGGYCLPKDTKQLASVFKNHNIAAPLISNIINSNNSRLAELTKIIQSKSVRNIGIFGIEMKQGSDNIRESSSLSLAQNLKNEGYNILIYDPNFRVDACQEFVRLTSFHEFVNKSELILANRWDKRLSNIDTPIFTRDIYNEN